jgi:hypothetical protein
MTSLRFLVSSVFATTAAELAEFEPLRRCLFVLSRHVVTTFTLTALEHNIIAWHKSFPFLVRSQWSVVSSPLTTDYSITSVIVPAPTVRPPSRIANRKPFSIAIGVINSISNATLSPGITISTPSGNVATPVTSVVRK